MTITALPSLDRTSATFKTDLDSLFLTALPAFSVEAEAARVAINANAETAEAARVTAQAAIDAGLANAEANAATATTKAGEANASAAEAAASAASIAGGPVSLAGAQTLTNKTFTGYTETTYALAGTDIAVANGSIQTKTLSANTTLTESLTEGQSVILGITAGAYSITWPSVTWAKVGGSGVAPTLTSTGVNWVILWQVGGIVRGSFMGTA